MVSQSHLFHQAAELDDDLHDVRAAPDDDLPCRGCRSIHCDGSCPQFSYWVTDQWLALDEATDGAA